MSHDRLLHNLKSNDDLDSSPPRQILCQQIEAQEFYDSKYVVLSSSVDRNDKSHLYPNSRLQLPKSEL
jgi:hypothetical protein